MKKIILNVLSILYCWHVNAQSPEPIPSYALNPQPLEWYKDQVKVWQKEISKNSKNLNAWSNLFKVVRILDYHDTTESKEVRNKQLEEVITNMEKAIPNSYEFNFCKWQYGGNDMSYYPYLEKAIKIDPNRTEHIDYMINIGELERDMKQRDEYALKKQQTNDMSVGMIYYNYNVIIGLEKNAILLTAGDNDTYPAWALQAKGIRKDVTILNYHLLHITDYREKVFKELGIPNVTLNSEEEFDFFNKELLQHLSKNSKNYPVYLSLTSAACNKYLNVIEQNLYLTGLAYIYKTNSFDNIAILKRNFEKLYALDYIDKDFYDEIAKGRIKEINRNYIIPMLKLYGHYKNSDDIQKQQWIKEKLIFISKDTEDEETVLKYLD